MAKIISRRITACIYCDYGRSGGEKGKRIMYCGLASSTWEVSTIAELKASPIPDWCPLEEDEKVK